MMGVERRRDSQWWYGRWEVNGKRFCKNLNIKVAGQEGERAFDKSRAKAQAELEKLMASSQEKGRSEELLQAIHRIRTGHEVGAIPLTDLPDRWAEIPRKKKPSDRYAAQCKSALVRFADFVTETDPDALAMDHVTPELARAFLEAEEARGVTAKTWNDTLKLLRATFKHLRRPAGIVDNPFEGIPTKETATVYRRPFSPEELQAIVQAAQEDDFIRPVIVTGICTAMRRGDCCRLRWRDVDLQQRYITVKTAKTGQTVDIPMFPMLADEIAMHPQEDTYVFPEQAAMYKTNPDGITWRVRKVFAAARFKDKADEEDEPIRGRIHADRKDGLRRASLRDFHSFRVTWVTLALSAGVPLELVQKVTGHKTAEIVMKHYFQPGRETFRKALHAVMPKLLTNGTATKKEEALALIATLNGRNVNKLKDELARIVEAI